MQPEQRKVGRPRQDDTGARAFALLAEGLDRDSVAEQCGYRTGHNAMQTARTFARRHGLPRPERPGKPPKRTTEGEDATRVEAEAANGQGGVPGAWHGEVESPAEETQP